MKTFEQIGLSIIKPTHKEGNDKIKEHLYKANDILYPIIKRPASQCAIVRVATALKEIYKSLMSVECTATAQPKKTEVCNILDSYIKAMRVYYSDIKDGIEDKEGAQRVLNYQVSQYLKNKEDILSSDDKILKQLKSNKEVFDDYTCVRGVVASTSYIRMQRELIQAITQKYAVEDIEMPY